MFGNHGLLTLGTIVEYLQNMLRSAAQLFGAATMSLNSCLKRNNDRHGSIFYKR